MQWLQLIRTYFKQFLLWENKNRGQEDEDECMNGGSDILRIEVFLTWTLDETGVGDVTWESLKVENVLKIRKFREIQRNLEA